MVADVEAGERGVIRVDEIDLREGDHPVRDPEQLEDAQMLLALRLPSFGRGDDEQAGVYRTDAREHVLDEAHVARDVDERDTRAGRQRRPREPEVDGEAASLLLLEPIGIGAGECEDEGRLAVIDVTGGRDDTAGRASSVKAAP